MTSTVWLTPARHRRILWTALITAASSTAIAAAAAYSIDTVGDVIAYNASGMAMLLQVGMLIGLCGYAIWHTFTSIGRSIVWGSNPTGSFMMGALGILLCLIPMSRVVQTQVWLTSQMHVTVQGDELRIGGSIPWDLADRIEALPLDGVRYVVLGTNQGGMVGGIFRAQPVFTKHNLDTVIIDGRCASSCAFLAMMFPKRLMAPGGALGYHKLRPATGGNSAYAEPAADRIRDVLEDHGYSPALVDRLFSTVDLHWYSAGEARSLGLITGCWDSVGQRDVPCV